MAGLRRHRLTTIGPRDLRVTGPNGFARDVVLVSAPLAVSSTNVLVRYKVSPPNGSEWTSADNGTYTISVLPDAVRSLEATAAEADELGSFLVNIA